MVPTLHRILRFASRVAVGVQQFGLGGACRVFFLSRWQQEDVVTSVPLRALGRSFFYRAVSDRNIFCMFYNEGYRIIDCYGMRARVIVDAGANIGDSTVRFRRFHPAARILAIEADPDNYQVLERNCTGDPLTTPLQRALWSEEGSLNVYKTWANVASRVTSAPHGQATAVPACTVPGLMAEFDLEWIDILKLDIEGAESVVFQTADTAWLHRVRCILFECCDADDAGTTQRIFAVLQGAGIQFNCHIAGENLVLIRSDTPWHVGSDLWLDEKATVPPHIAQAMASRGLSRLDEAR
jgi:FkbM family methyltransferase